MYGLQQSILNEFPCHVTIRKWSLYHWTLSFFLFYFAHSIYHKGGEPVMVPDVESDVKLLQQVLHHLHHAPIVEIDQQSTLFPLLSWPTFPLSGQWGDFEDYRTFVNSLTVFLILILKQTIWSQFIHEVGIMKYSKTNIDKSTEIFPPLISISICACSMPRATTVQPNVYIFKEDEIALPLWS